ncbi:hypothetical protein ADK57_37410 [Streptomyces sp. MMG1533]|uniref:hypothetical protein n=1 Tax=Streptomyces sp. MMG1533 TaxID=1415546 RepID=UPI0006B00B28|nr:hypothetical protein [Streptomyces sp. MMG1533]KOU57868.1 hypothetical protein ADK57_37410 [Streptomyces sp. MMG1533]
MAWTRALLAALAVCVLLLTGSAGCGTGGADEQKNGGDAPSPVGEVLNDTDGEGRHYREVDDKEAPDVGIEVQPDTDDSWRVRLALQDFRFSPAGAKEAVAGRGIVRLFVDGHLVARLRTPEYRLSARYVPHGTHHVTARLYADDGTVWAVDGEPVESTADITASGSSGPSGSSAPSALSGPERAGTTNDALSAPGPGLRTEGRGSPDRGGKAS